MGKIDEQGRKQGEFVEGRESEPHTHSDKAKGTDIQAHRVTYKDDKEVASKKLPDEQWGKLHQNKP